MTKEELMKKAREVFMAGIRMIDDNDLSGSLKKAQVFWAEQKALFCTNTQEEEWWDVGFQYGSEENKAEFEAWNSAYWKLCDFLNETDLTESGKETVINSWNNQYCREHYGDIDICEIKPVYKA